MIDASKIRSLAAQVELDPGVVEKDYVLSKILMALAQVDSFSNNLVFKGGTALKKCYYPHWRFSEDLDFTSRAPMKPKEVKAIFKQVVEATTTLFGLATRVIEYSQ